MGASGDEHDGQIEDGDARLEGHDLDADVHTDFERETRRQVEEAATALEPIEGIKAAVWDALDAYGRLMVLQAIEARMAAIQGRPTVIVIAADMEPGAFGAYDGRRITINAAH